MSSDEIFKEINQEFNKLAQSEKYDLKNIEFGITTSPLQVYNMFNPMPKVIFWHDEHKSREIYKKICEKFKIASIENPVGQYLYILLTSWDKLRI